MNKQEIYQAGYENGVADAQDIVHRARQLPSAPSEWLIEKIQIELDKLRYYSKEQK